MSKYDKGSGTLVQVDSYMRITSNGVEYGCSKCGNTYTKQTECMCGNPILELIK